ncbi:MAG: VTT domain-containing protein [Chloroflexi bacterium]|nr:VTT domain-containing protein [Chloroflexota bacterium]
MAAMTDRVEWAKIALLVFVMVAVSFALSYFFQNLVNSVQLPLYDMAWLAYLTVFLSAMISNLTIVAPVPIILSVVAAASMVWNPALVAAVATVGASLGELSAYYLGRAGRKVVIPESMLCRVKSIFCHAQIEQNVQRYGPLAIFVLAIQPVLPFDVGGLIAGAARMPLRKFLPALMAGRFPKFLFLAYVGTQFISRIPFLSVSR